MSLRVSEWFGHLLSDTSPEAVRCRREGHCPFIGSACTKSFNDGSPSGVCSVQTSAGGVIPICPNRLYADEYKFLNRIAQVSFGTREPVIRPEKIFAYQEAEERVVAFGQRFGSELKLPKRGGKGSYSVDWILAKVDREGTLLEFVAVEVQTIDTTGSYKPEVESLRRGENPSGASQAGLNWENVNKRILPQLIYKGHVLRREAKCTKGLFFVCPQPVHERIAMRLGGSLLRYENLQPGSIVFQWYTLEDGGNERGRLDLSYADELRSTVDQVATAFTSPTNLPEAGVYEAAINRAISRFR